jgi:DNA-binding CsgD family transcriptional regulator
MNPSLDSRVATVESWVSAYDARDVEALCALAHPEIVVLPIIPPVPELPGVTFTGRAGLRRLMQWSFDKYPDVRVKSWAYRDVPPSILLSTTHVLESANPLVESTHTLFDVDDEGIRRLAAFFSEAEALAAVGAKPVLTPREREVFQLLARGSTAPEIADELVLAPATVRTHVQNGMRRLGAKTRIQAVSIALRRREIAP